MRKCNKHQTDDVFCFKFGDETTFLRLFPYNLKDAQVHCNDIVWTNMKSNYHIPVDCFDIEFGLWYGLPNFKGSFWPLKRNIKCPLDKVWALILKQLILQQEIVFSSYKLILRSMISQK